MVIDIWSDIACPFCYIGKKRLDLALSELSIPDVHIRFRSFLLNPDLKTDESMSLYDYLETEKGWKREQVRSINAQLTESSKGLGIAFNFDVVKVASSVNAHRLVQLAERSGKASHVIDLLFKAYFTDGNNIDDPVTLTVIGQTAGIPEQEIRDMLNGTAYYEEVNVDRQLAAQLNIHAVPFFVINDRYAIRGAQETAVFTNALQTIQLESENVIR